MSKIVKILLVVGCFAALVLAVAGGYFALKVGGVVTDRDVAVYFPQDVPGSQDTDDEITRDQLTADLLNAAFSNRIWNDDVINKRDGTPAFDKMIGRYRREKIYDGHAEKSKYYPDKKKRMPWVIDHWYRTNGWPKHNAVNKWKTKKVDVAFGWPIYRLDGHDRDQHGRPITASWFNIQNSMRFYPKIRESALRTIESINASGSVRMNFVDVGDKAEQTENYARIRIIPTNMLYFRSWSEVESYSMIMEMHEHVFWHAVPLVTRSKKMEAYILPDHENNIDLVICKISPDSTDSEIDEFVSDCLLKGLGLPELTRTQGAISKAELELVDLLYCSAIKSGMGKMDAFHLLAERKACWW